MVSESALNSGEIPPISLASSKLPVASSEWNDEAVFCLLDNYSHKFSVARGYLRTKDWEGVVAAVNQVSGSDGAKLSKTMKQCRDKIDSLKRRYKIEKRKAIEGGFGLISWPYFNHLDHLMSSVAALKQPLIPASNPHFHPNSNPLANPFQPTHCLTYHLGRSGGSIGGDQFEGGASGGGGGDGVRGNGKPANPFGLSSNHHRSPIIHNNNEDNYDEDDDDDDDRKGEQDTTKHNLESSRSPDCTFRHEHAQTYRDFAIDGTNRYNNKSNLIPRVHTSDDDDDDHGFAAVVYPNHRRIHHLNKRESSPPPGPTNRYPSQPNGGADMDMHGDCRHQCHHHQKDGIPNTVKKRKAQQLPSRPHPAYPLANAVTGFAHVFARIELAKLEIFTKMELEMAKLSRRKSRRSRRKRHRASTSSTGTFGSR